MAKDPAFLFYPNDWVGGTMGMTFEEKGAYMELLMMQFNRGHMTEHMIGQTVGQLFSRIKDKFIQDAEGLWYNERLDIEKEKRKNYVNSRNNNKLGKNKYTKKEQEDVSHMTSHMDNENEDSVLNKKRNKEKQNFNTFPKPEDFNGLPDITLGSIKELIKITKQVSVTDEQVKGMWGVFKNQELTGEKFYKSEKDVYSHFTNWMKFQKFDIRSNEFINKENKPIQPKINL